MKLIACIALESGLARAKGERLALKINYQVSEQGCEVLDGLAVLVCLALFVAVAQMWRQRPLHLLLALTQAGLLADFALTITALLLLGFILVLFTDSPH